MSIFTEARAELADALADIPGITIYNPAGKTPIPPAVAIANDNPWIIPARIGGPLRVDHRLRLMCAVRDTPDNLPQLEQLVQDVLEAIDGLAEVDEITAPVSLDTGTTGTVLTAEIRLTLRLKE